MPGQHPNQWQLDPVGRDRARPELQGRFAGLLIATHDVEFVASVADDVVVLAEGAVVSTGRTRQVRTKAVRAARRS